MSRQQLNPTASTCANFAGTGDSGADKQSPPYTLSSEGSLQAAKKQVVEAFERDYLIRLMSEHHGNLSKAAAAAQKKTRFQQTAQETPHRSCVVPRVRLIRNRVGTHPQPRNCPHSYKCGKRGRFSAQSELSAGASRPAPLYSVDQDYEKTTF